MPPTLVPAGLSERLAQFIRKLCGAIGDYGLKHRSVLPVLNLAVTRLFRLSAQFAELVAKVREGRLPAQRTTRRRADPAPARALPPGSEAEASPSVPGPPMPELPRLPARLRLAAAYYESESVRAGGCGTYPRADA